MKNPNNPIHNKPREYFQKMAAIRKYKRRKLLFEHEAMTRILQTKAPHLYPFWPPGHQHAEVGHKVLAELGVM